MGGARMRRAGIGRWSVGARAAALLVAGSWLASAFASPALAGEGHTRLAAAGHPAGTLAAAGHPASTLAAAGHPASTLAAPGNPASVEVPAGAVSDPLAYPEGPGTVSPAVNGSASSGEGVLWLTMSAPGTSWASPSDTAVVVDVRLDAGPAQQVVLFYGARPFTYEAFTGSVGPGRHRVTVSVDPVLSHVQGRVPEVRLEAATLGVVAPGAAGYLLDAYAPVLYGRPSAGQRYTPLLDDAAETSEADGSHELSYVMVFSAHDQGDSVVPAYQWGLWGRMTDVVSVLEETVAPDGDVTSATYASCGCESLPWPPGVMAPEETTAAFEGAWFGHHPVLRDATATNYMSDEGTSAFRFQQAPMAAPAPGQLRSEVMDLHPWTYQVSNEELPREHLISTDPDNLLVGDYRQYAIVDADVAVSGAQSVAVELRLAGSPTWYSNDYRQATAGVASTFPFHDGGHWRTVVKLPLDWARRAITGIRLRLNVPPGATATPKISIGSLEVLEVTPAYTVEARTYPPVVAYTQPSLVPVAPPS